MEFLEASVEIPFLVAPDAVLNFEKGQKFSVQVDYF
jgi:hypothetical protein